MLQGQTRFLEAIASSAIASREYERLSSALDSSLQEVADPVPEGASPKGLSTGAAKAGAPALPSLRKKRMPPPFSPFSAR